MMTRKITLLTAAICCLICAASAQKGFNISIKFSHYIPQKVRLAYFYEDKQYIQVDSASQSGNMVTFHGDQELYPGIYSVILDSAATSFELLIDGQNQNFQLRCDMNDIQKTMKVTGSDLNAKFYDYQRLMTDLITKRRYLDSARVKEHADTAKIDMELAKIDISIEDAWRNTVAGNPGSFLADMLNCMNARNFGFEKMCDYVNFGQKGLIRTPFFYNIIRAQIAHYLNANASAYEIIRQNDVFIERSKASEDVYHYVTAYMLNFYRTFFKLGINEVFVHLADKYFLAPGINISADNRNMIQEQRDIYAASIPGSDAKPVRMANTMTGDSVDILGIKHETMFLLFWSNGCGHCDSAENALKLYYDKLVKQGVVVVSVNNDKHDIKYLRQNTGKKNFPWQDFCDTEEKSYYRQYYYVVSTPIMYVIDDKNRIVQKVVGEDNITEVARRYSGL